jgi:hypothetical protein
MIARKEAITTMAEVFVVAGVRIAREGGSRLTRKQTEA